MKKLLNFFSILFLLMQSCSSNDSSSNKPLTAEAVQNIVKSGTWKVTYIDNQGGLDKTNEFQGYSFSFNQTNNSITSNHVSNNFQGTWRIDIPVLNQVYLSIDFHEASNLYFLGAYWQLISITNNKIVLKLYGNDGISEWYHPQGISDPFYWPNNLIFEKI